ncbi:hypothetical protein MMB19_27715 (plasmid) [Ralstonia insidiosa]|nr:hypothetical protein MMB19_27715 [Ralstonia insidiosa]
MAGAAHGRRQFSAQPGGHAPYLRVRDEGLLRQLGLRLQFAIDGQVARPHRPGIQPLDDRAQEREMATVEVASNDNAAAGGSSALYFTLQRLEAGGGSGLWSGSSGSMGGEALSGLGFRACWKTRKSDVLESVH